MFTYRLTLIHSLSELVVIPFFPFIFSRFVYLNKIFSSLNFISKSFERFNMAVHPVAYTILCNYVKVNTFR